MKGNGRRDKTRRYIILTLYIVAVLFAVAAVVYEPNRAFYAAIAGYDMLFLVSYFVTSLAQNVPNSGKYMLLSFSVCLLFAVIIALLYLLFFSRMKEAKTEVTEVPPEEIRIPSAPQVMGTVWIMDDASPHLQDASESEATPTDTDEEPVLVIPADDAEDTTLLTDDSQIKAEDTAIPEDSTLPESADFIDIPDVPVFTEAIIKTEEITADVVLVPPETEKISEVPSTPAFTEAILTLDKTTATVSLITFPDKPFMLEPIMEIGEAKIPSAPSIIEPNAIISEEAEPAITPEPVKETSNDDFFSGLSPEEADFWADFYIAGEDELELADGIYYMDLYVNDNYLGRISTEVISGKASINKAELQSYLSGSVNDNMIASLTAGDYPYISLDAVISLGVQAEFDPNNYAVYLKFSSADMPVQILSIRGSAVSRNAFRPIAGGLNLRPAFFVLETDWRLSARISSFEENRWRSSLNFTFSSDNSGRISDVYFNFSYYMDFSPLSFNFRFGSYRFYKDFENAMIRLQWGNVSSVLLGPKGKSFGIRFDRSYSYSSTDVKKRSFIDQILFVEKESEVIIYNQGREIFRRTLEAGNYRLQDFILYSGANNITIRIEPLDGSAPTEQVIDVLYSSAILPPGDVYYGASFVFGRETVVSKDSGTLTIPLWNNRYLQYDWKNAVLSGYIRAGLTHTLSISSSLGLQNYPTDEHPFNPRLQLNTELTHANILGTTRYTLNVKESLDDNGRFELPGIYAYIGHQVSTGWRPISSISLGVTYSNPEENNLANRHRFSVSAGLSGSFGFMSWSANGSGTVYTDVPDDFTWSVSGTASFNLTRSLWLSGSINLNASGVEKLPTVTGRVYATVRFGGGSVSASSSFKDLSVSASYYTGRHSISVNANTNDFTNPGRYSASADYSYDGRWLDFSFGAGSSFDFRNPSIDMSLSTSTLFADGMFTLGADIPNNFILIRQDGALKGNSLSAGRTGSSTPAELKPIFGTYLYDGLSGSGGTVLSMFSTDEDAFGGASIFDVNVYPSNLYGYTLRLSAEPRYAVSGTVELPDGSMWTNGSSPVYEVSYADNGSIELKPTELYIFTDSDGRFVLSDLEAGTFAFAVNHGNDWILAILTASEIADGASGVQLLSQAPSEIENLPEPYIDSISYDFHSVLSSSQFWKMLYPEMKEAI